MILLDMELADIDGQRFLSEIRRSPEADRIPIIVDMTRTTTNVMFVMITVATTISRRFARISKVFATRAMKSNKIAGSYVAIIGS